MSKVLIRRAVACSAAFGLLAACSSSKSISSETTGAASTTAAPTTVPVLDTVAPTTVAVTTPAPTDPPAPVCSNTTEPSAEALSLTVVDGDWNGDGAMDLGYSWGEPIGGSMKWFVRAEVSGGAGSAFELGDLGVGYAQALDGVDVDFALGAEPGVNRDELLAVVGGGASGLNVGVFGFDGDDCLFQFDDGAGAPFETPVAATIHQMSGLMCDGAMGSQFLVELHASTFDDVTWTTVDYRLEREGQSLLRGIALENSLPAGDPALDAYSHAQCGGTVWI